MATKKPRFETIVKTSLKGPEDAARKADLAARKAGGEQISIAADVVFGSDAQLQKQLDTMLNNIAQNIYQLVQCSCPEIIGQKIIKPGSPPPFHSPFSIVTAPQTPMWVVYILIKHH